MKFNQCKNNLYSINKYFNDIYFTIKYLDNIKTLSELNEDNKKINQEIKEKLLSYVFKIFHF